MSIARIFTSFTRKEVRQLFQTARRVAKEQELTILLAPKQDSVGRLLVVIPRAVGNSPIRNRLRRQLKSIFYEKRLFEHDVDCAIITRHGAAILPFKRLEELMLKAFSSTKPQEPRKQ